MRSFSSSLVRSTFLSVACAGSAIGVACGAMLAGCQQADPLAPTAAVVKAPIVNGQTETGWPGVGALTVSLGNRYGGEYCTASLVAKDWVVTAGHCTTGQELADEGITAENTSFYVGNDARPTAGGAPTNGKFYKVDAFVPYPQYDPNRNTNDIGLVHLAEPVEDGTINAFATTSLSDYFNAHKPVTLLYVGFGATEGIRESGSGLKRSTRFDITSVQNTTFQSDYKGTGTCFGDSGGPNILEGATPDDPPTIVGLTSAGDACPPNNPNCDPCQTETISTRVDAFAAWIQTTIGGPPPTCQTIPAMCLCAEGCTADGTCDNTQCHVASCNDTYACVNACAGDQSCIDTCIAEGTPDAQAQVQALLACSADKCPDTSNPQAHRTCVRDQCRIPYNVCTGRGPTATGNESCSQVYDCVDACQDFNCQTACENEGTADAQSQIDALLRCLRNNCRDATTEADYLACADQNCPDEEAACFPPPVGDKSCADVKSCADACSGDGAAACVSGCRTTGTADAQGQWDALASCMKDNCADESGGDAEACLVASCAVVAITCAPGSVGAGCNLAGGDCPDGTACSGTASATSCVASAGKAVGEACATTEVDCADGLSCAADASGATVCTAPTPPCVDADGDGSCLPDDCDDAAASVHPGATEVCDDGIDNDCDGVIDNGCPAPTGPSTSGKKDSGCAGGDTGALALGLAGLALVLARRVRARRVA